MHWRSFGGVANDVSRPETDGFSSSRIISFWTSVMKQRIALIGMFSLFSLGHAAEICTAIADASSGEVVVQRGECKKQVTPASTFKIAISLMAYDSGFLKDAYTPELPYQPGYPDWLASWKYPTNPQKWMNDSVVWFSQKVTQSLGKEHFAAYTRKFEYGNADVSAGVLKSGHPV
jgi:beta-lactamase class D